MSEQPREPGRATEEARFTYWDANNQLSHESDVVGVIHQDDLEKVLTALQEMRSKEHGNRYPPRFWNPIISVSYKENGKIRYEHFCAANCVGMFRDRSEELQKAVDDGRVSDVVVYRTEFNIKLIPANERLNETKVD
jgi:hypothetical protein